MAESIAPIGTTGSPHSRAEMEAARARVEAEQRQTVAATRLADAAPGQARVGKVAAIYEQGPEAERSGSGFDSSAGSFDNKFLKVPEGNEQDDECHEISDRTFYIRTEPPKRKRLPTREVEPRNTPTTINAVFLQRNFWDSRANSLFNGVGVFGMRDIKGDPTKRLIVKDGDGLKLTWLEIENASLASQAVGPPTSQLEMSCGGRIFPDVGKKMVGRKPLALHEVADRSACPVQPGAVRRARAAHLERSQGGGRGP